MAKRSTSGSAGKSNGKATQPRKPAGVDPTARSLGIAEKGVKTGEDMMSCMSALMADLLAERVPVKLGNAVCGAARNMLATAALQMRLEGNTANPAKRRHLVLVSGGRG